ncbi:hypothetical protein [Sulfurovum mangrovi]|uniref:hypothetical protein n=1 Tax=Sulfurovum mangrovi TaxID=2893889 RepID=UPI001E47C01A|nr:hypothetical protein [Sulfurovum mangrovi]UFH60476.1 hypothetical protein LN246_06360 [Sulfurovum mangrovi]
MSSLLPTTDKVLPVVIHDDIMSKIFNYFKDSEEKNYTGYTYAVYAFLYHTARRQKNIRVYATDTFIMKGTGIGQSLLPKIKKFLAELDLIEVIQDRSGSGTFAKRYIEVKFVWKPETLDKLFYQEDNLSTQYKIAKELLWNNSHPYEELEANKMFEFDAMVNGQDATLCAEIFYFNEDRHLIAKAMADRGEYELDYTVTTDNVHEVIMSLADNYKYSFSAVLKTLQTKTENIFTTP